jgi:hypothetical protein
MRQIPATVAAALGDRLAPAIAHPHDLVFHPRDAPAARFDFNGANRLMLSLGEPPVRR